MSGNFNYLLQEKQLNSINLTSYNQSFWVTSQQVLLLTSLARRHYAHSFGYSQDDLDCLTDLSINIGLNSCPVYLEHSSIVRSDQIHCSMWINFLDHEWP